MGSREGKVLRLMDGFVAGELHRCGEVAAGCNEAVAGSTPKRSDSCAIRKP